MSGNFLTARILQAMLKMFFCDMKITVSVKCLNYYMKSTAMKNSIQKILSW